jgi:serine/threonine protein kinase
LTTDHQRRVRAIFDAALDQPQELRQQFLAGACQGDQKLLDTVGRLLAAQERSAGVLDTPAWQRRETASPPGEPGSFIGPYKVLRELGGGGMGIVYQAVRADEVFHRICAIKVIRPEISTDTLLQRFRQERKILARLDHVNIARIVDGGSTSDGLPYFVMDFVDGPPINKFCSEHGLEIRPRLGLFQQVCAAVQYLHNNNVIHGDLKPPNILVGNDGTVKLVDFGIASALSSGDVEDHNKSLPLMTPGYASPEQIQGKPLAPASDVYSLGIILYELLAGSQPFASAQRSRSEMLSAIATQKPVPPSAAANVSTLPSQRAASQEIKGDLDAVVLRAMHRDPQQRYQSAAELSSDIRRFLENRPVAAQKTSLLHRAEKFIARHRAGMAAAVLICALLATTIWQGLEMHSRYKHAMELEDQLRILQSQLDERVRQLRPEQLNALPGGANSPLAQQLQETELKDVKNLADAYRTSFPEAVRLWPGMTRSRQDLIDHTDQYLRQVEPYVSHDPQASERLASAWLWMANLQGNPQTINLHDRTGAAASIGQAQRLLDKSSIVSSPLMEQVKTSARQIEAAVQ